jgi:hypothetical protein
MDDRMASFYHDGYGPVASTTKWVSLVGESLATAYEIQRKSVSSLLLIQLVDELTSQPTAQIGVLYDDTRGNMTFLINIWMIQKGFRAAFICWPGGGSQVQRDDSTLATKMRKTGMIKNKITRNALNRLQRIYKNGRSLIIEYAPLHCLSWKKSSTSFSK